MFNVVWESRARSSFARLSGRWVTLTQRQNKLRDSSKIHSMTMKTISSTAPVTGVVIGRMAS